MDKILLIDGPASPLGEETTHQNYRATALPAVATPVKATTVAVTPK